MSDNKLYFALGEEAARGTKEASTVGFLPARTGSLPQMAFDDKTRKEFRGEDSLRGPTQRRRMSRSWTWSPDIPFYTEAGSAKAIAAQLLKHFFGKAVGAQNGATGQYYWMMYETANPDDPANLGAKALTVHANLNEGAVMKDWPFVGGRVKSLEFSQEPGDQLIIKPELFGQFRDTVVAELGSPVAPAENLRLDFNHLKCYIGTITRVGVAPNFTNFTFGSATQFKPDKVTVKVSKASEDKLRLAGVNYPDKTRMGIFEVTAEIAIDWEDPAAGFSSVDEFNAWMASITETNMFFHWDTGVQAGTGDNHGLYLDLPRLVRDGGDPEYDLEKDPMITLKYSGLVDMVTAKYMIGCMIKNTASAV